MRLRTPFPRLAVRCGAWMALCLSAAAQTGRARPFPMDVLALDATHGTLEVSPRPAELALLTRLERTLLVGAALPDGSRADFELERLDLARLQLGIRVDGVAAPRLLEELDLSVWVGHVRGASSSEVRLAFSRFGSHGWVRRDGELFHLTAKPDSSGDWECGSSIWINETSLAALGVAPPPLCSGDAATSLGGATRELPDALVNGASALTSSLYKCSIAVETDFELFQIFNNLSAETAYVTSLLAWVSYRYEEQVKTVLTYPYLQLYTSNDPWTSTDSVSMLYELQGAWQFNVPTGAELGAFVSGAGLGGGVAWLPGLCNEPYNFSVSGNLAGQTPFPIVPNHPANWDFVVIAHELGHNFDAIHTHDYCPTPVDQCAPSGYFGSCQSAMVCTNQGSIMSYCHLCPGGFANETAQFHPASVADMRAYVEGSCLPLACSDPVNYCSAKTNSLGCVPQISYTGHPMLGGLDDFHVTASNVLNQKTGLMYWGFAPLNAPFQGGVKCVASPSKRTPLQNSNGPTSGSSCTGAYDFFMSHGYMQSQSLAAGDTLYCQYWMRDPADPFTTGLTAGLRFDICQ